MTKEKTVEVLKNAAWNGADETRDETVEAIGTAIAAINMMDLIAGYVEHFMNGMMKRSQEGQTTSFFNDGAVSALESVLDYVRSLQERLYDK